METTLLQFSSASAEAPARRNLPVPGATGHPFLLAAFRVILARFARNPRFAIAVFSPDQSGVFVDDLSDNPTFGELVHRPQRDGDPSLPIQVAFRQGGAMNPAKESSIELVTDETGVTLHFSTSLLPEETAARLVSHLVCLLRRARLEDRIADVPSAPEAERALLAGFNQTEAGYPAESLLELFDRQDPDRVALIASRGPVTYRQLSALRDEYAAQLAGILPGEHAGLCLHRSPEFVAAMLACMKAGAVFVPIDPNYPEDRTRFMIEDCEARFLFTHKGADVVVEARPAPYSRSPAGSLYLLYTSGSTGRPKGVIGTHAATLNRLHWMWQAWPYRPDDVACAKTSPNFVDAIAEVFGPLLQGVPVVVLNDTDARDPMALAKAMWDPLESTCRHASLSIL